MKVMTVPKLELQAALLAARLKNEFFQALAVTVNKVLLRTDSTILLQWINSNEKQPINLANRFCEILEYTSVDQWNHVATKDNHPTDAGTRGMSAEVLQLSSWVKTPQFITNPRFPFVPNKDVIVNLKLGVNEAVTIEHTVSLAISVKNEQLLFLQCFHLMSLILIKSTCALLHTCSDFCRNMPSTVSSMAALLTLMSLTKPRVISSTW